MHKTEILMQNYPTCTQNHVLLGYISQFFVLSDIFCLYFYFLYAYAVFPFARFHLRLLSQMLRLEFHVNQHGLKRHHWSTSSWLTAPPQPISRRGAVTSLQCASLAADAQCSLVQVKMDYCQLGNILPYITPLCVHLSLLYVYLAIR